MGRLSILARWSLLGLSAAAVAACSGTSVIGGGTGGSGSSGSSSSGGPGQLAPVDKIDIVLAIDNSRSMADKQEILSLALSDLVTTLANPKCVDQNDIPSPSQPMSPNDACPAGYQREYPPIRDIHVGIIDSSLGGHGSDSCPVQGDTSCGNNTNPSNNDAAHLVARPDACSAQSIPTYKGSSGFLAWDPEQKLMPPGEPDIGALGGTLKNMVIGTGQIGCGYESQLESWYRFLIDPEPYQSISVSGATGKATPMGVDNTLLAQRSDFLRPDSLLAILMLSDEDDCSIKEFGQFYYAGQLRNPGDPATPFHMPHPRSECATNPNDPCCKSCVTDPMVCPTDPACAGSPLLDDLEDNPNLRCWANKRRFGIDFLYPSDRYIQGLSSLQIPNRAGELVPNPLFSDLNPNDADSTIRDASMVVLAGIVGVPWQDIARDPADLTKGYKNAAELAAADGAGHTTWDKIIGDPANYVPPLDPHMIESVEPRAGLPPPGSAPNADPIHGHEYSIPNRDDLQYACVFDLGNPRDCMPQNGPAITPSCDCTDAANDSPLCDPQTHTIQVRAKAYPGTRQLSVLKGLGSQGVVASICPSQANDPTRNDYAYRPALNSLLERVKARIKLAY